MKVIKSPIDYLQRIIKCDRCKKDFVQKLVVARKEWSQINNVSYWTNGKIWGKFKTLCRQCLKAWHEESRKEFNSLVNLQKRKIFSNYKNSGVFDKNDKEIKYESH